MKERKKERKEGRKEERKKTLSNLPLSSKEGKLIRRSQNLKNARYPRIDMFHFP